MRTKTAGKNYGELVRILLVLDDAEVRETLLHILSHSKWSVQVAAGFEEARVLLRTAQIGVVLTAYRPCGHYSWRDLLDETQRFSPPPRVVVTDRAADDAMWAEALNLGAYDVLAQPFNPHEVLRALSLAWQSWRNDGRRVMTSGGGSAAA